MSNINPCTHIIYFYCNLRILGEISVLENNCVRTVEFNYFLKYKFTNT